MDPFSLATGIAGLISVTVQLGSSLKEFEHSYRGARESYKHLGSELEAVASALSTLQAHIGRQGAHIPATTLLKEPIDQCSATLEQIRAEYLPKNPMSRRRRLVQVFSDERRVIDFIARLERYKTMFTLALGVDLSGQFDGVQLGISKLLNIAEEDHQNAIIEKSVEQLRRILDWLGPLPVDARLENILQLRQPDTCKWMFDYPVFESWKKSSSGSFIWLHGISGSGKTVMSSVITDHLLRKCTNEVAGIYVFCEFRNQQSVIPETILRTLLSGLLRAYPQRITPDFNDIVEEEQERRSPPQTVARILELIRRAARRFKQVYLVLDGLDECERKERSQLLRLLPTLASDDGFNVFVASRPEVDIDEAFHHVDTISLQMQMEDVHSDIKLFINHELETRRELARLPKKLKDEIKMTLESKASGMFRLVECQLDVLVHKPTPSGVRRALQNLPEKLVDIYDRILKRIDEDTEVIARRALRWLADVKHPIRLEQLAEAIMIESCGTELNTEYLVTSDVVILEALSSLVTHNPLDHFVSLSHMSVLEYLMSSRLLETPFKNYRLPRPPVLANEMLSLLLDYMLIDDFNRPEFETENELNRFVTEEHPFYNYAAVSWIEYISQVDVSCAGTLKALLHFIQSTNDCHKLAHQVFASYQNHGFSQYGHLEHPLRRMCYWSIPHSVIEHLPALELPADLIQCCLFLSIWRGNTQLVESFLEFGMADVNREHRCSFEDHPPHSSAPCNALTNAFDAGDVSMVRLLIKRGANPSHVLADGWTMLHSATTSGYLEAVQMVLEEPSFKADVHARHSSGITAYRIAVQMEAKEIARYLEDHGASEELDLSDDTPAGIGEREVIQVGLCLAQMLRAEFKLVPHILNLAEYWAMSSATKSTPEGALYVQNSLDEPYITLKISGGGKAPLRRLVFTTTSHDQGWSDHTAHIGTYRESCSWFEVGNGSLRTVGRLRFQFNLHGSDKPLVHRNVWERSTATGDFISNWMGMFRNGDIVEVYAKAMFAGWANYVYSVDIVAYTSCF